MRMNDDSWFSPMDILRLSVGTWMSLGLHAGVGVVALLMTIRLPSCAPPAVVHVEAEPRLERLETIDLELKPVAELAPAEADLASGGRAKGDEGKMGGDKDGDGRFGIQGPPDAERAKRISAELDKLNVGILGALKSSGESSVSSVFKDGALGDDPMSARGNMWGDSIGESFGKGGLGTRGIGEGGGGRGEGIGLGSIGTIGHGAGAGTGQGYGSGSGRLGRGSGGVVGGVAGGVSGEIARGGGGLRPGAGGGAGLADIGGVKMKEEPSGDVRVGGVQVTGSLASDNVSRALRARTPRLRQCYEAALARDGSLAGRVEASLEIDADGRVSSVTEVPRSKTGDEGTTLGDGAAVRCVIGALRGLSRLKPVEGSATAVVKINFSPR